MPRWLLVIALPLAIFAQDAGAPANPGSVRGSVTDAQTGEAVSGATVRLFPRGVRGQFQPPTTTSLGDGSFRFDSVVPGSYTVTVRSRGFTSAGSPAQVITVADGEAFANVAIRLNPLGAVSGRVSDAAGHPVAEADVQLFRTYNLRGRTQVTRVGDTQSAKDGTYVFRRVIPGKYYVAADAENRVRTFYPKSLDLENAALLDLGPGGSASDTTIILRQAPTFHVRGKIESFAPGALQKDARIILAPRDAPAFGALSSFSKPLPDGAFDFRRVLDGSYTVWLVGSYAGTVAPVYRRARSRLLARQDVDVNGSDANGVSLPLMPPVNISGRLTIESAPAGVSLSQIRINLQPAGQMGFGSYQSAVPASDGSFSFNDLDPGNYMVRVLNVPGGLFVAGASLNRQDVLESGLDLSQGGGGDLQIALRSGAAEVDGSIESEHGQTVSNGVALLIPETPPADGSGVLSGILKPGGVFAIANVPPGRYYAFAVQDWDSVWQNPDFERAMQRQGNSIEVGQNGHVQMQLRMLPEEQVEASAEQLGLSLQ